MPDHEFQVHERNCIPTVTCLITCRDVPKSKMKLHARRYRVNQWQSQENVRLGKSEGFLNSFIVHHLPWSNRTGKLFHLKIPTRSCEGGIHTVNYEFIEVSRKIINWLSYTVHFGGVWGKEESSPELLCVGDGAWTHWSTGMKDPWNKEESKPAAFK